MTFPGSALAEFDAALAAARSAREARDALCALARATVGAKLFTIMEIDNERQLQARVYTSDPVSYPVSGTKSLNHGPWFDQIHGRKEPFVANTIGDIAKVLFDHEIIRSLGCGSIINLPVEIAGEVVAVVNMLDVEHHYTPERVAQALQLGLPARATWLASRVLPAD